MRTTSLVLGIIGSALAILFGGMSMLTALFADSGTSGGYYFDDSFDAAALTAESLPDLSSSFWDKVDVAQFWLGCAAVVGGLLGTAGSIIVTGRSRAAGALFVAASVISIETVVSTVLFIIAAVYALKPQPAVPQMMPPGPYAGYSPYPHAASPPPYPAAPPAAYPSPPQPYGTYPPPYGAAPGVSPPPPQPKDAYPPYGPPGAAWPPYPQPAQPGEKTNSQKG